VNKNAYIQTALFGYPFCKASQEAFDLIARNASKMTAVGFISQLSLTFCKLVITVIIGVASYFTMQYLYKNDMYSIVSVTFFISIISWFIASMFMG